ncbi:signal peptidase, endoplasmic reticulum-type [Georgenia soli]|uniref:Signal peptidase I n=1 Tax=Georgenia soli TaxID=638953 RepID=A0A2A9EJ67_9MICO|nr:signal peptidase I [Georgenia soli]PFG38279.1 signal peptidase, endoplasmic reticulum-type [Georgenia soli]
MTITAIRTSRTAPRRAPGLSGALPQVGNVLLVAIMVVAAIYLLPGLLGYQRYVITGGSMSGTFEKGSIAFERTVPVAALEVGDVITYMPPADSGVDNLVTHRISEITTGENGTPLLRTKGDANADVDPWAFQLVDDLQPVVSFTVPYLGYVFMALADPTVRVLVIGVPAGLVALRSLVDVVRALRGGHGTEVAA